MSQPEIARRCSACGASIRVRGSFCPECGKPLSSKSDGDVSGDSQAVAPLAVTQDLAAETAQLSEKTLSDINLSDSQLSDSESSDTAPLDSSAITHPLDYSAVTKPLDSRDTVAAPGSLTTEAPATQKRPRQATVGMVQHSGVPPRRVRDDGELNRVEKFRQMSSAVIDEAGYDPSLRFVLVAAVLFVLFLVLLLVSELIT
jgi:hypothetical protein